MHPSVSTSHATQSPTKIRAFATKFDPAAGQDPITGGFA
jgi:hypothetical protein